MRIYFNYYYRCDDCDEEWLGDGDYEECPCCHEETPPEDLNPWTRRNPEKSQLNTEV